MSEIYWELVELFNEKYKYVLELRGQFLAQRSTIYANITEATGALLPNCVGFTESSKIKIAKPGGDSILLNSCYSRHKRTDCLSYQTLTTPDGLIFAMLGPIEE